MLQQLGGNRFVTMTGARDFVTSDNPQPRLRMSLPAKQTKGRGSYMEISLAPSDEYLMVFFRMWKGERKFVEVRRGVQVADLRRSFTEMTGLDVSLGEQFDRREMLTANGG